MSEIKTVLNDSNDKICVEIFCPQEPQETIVFCHGITGCRKGRTTDDSYFQDLAKILCDLGYKVVLFDFSGHGDSEGNEYDVCISKNTKELEKVFEQEVIDANKVSFLAFSYGAAVLCNFLSHNEAIRPRKIVLYSPCFFPNESCFLNKNSVFGKDIVSALNDGSMFKNGLAVVGAKNFKVGIKLINECVGFSPDYFLKFRDDILVCTGREDVILNTSLNEDYCNKNQISNVYFTASHSLYEKIGLVFRATVAFFSDEL